MLRLHTSNLPYRTELLDGSNNHIAVAVSTADQQNELRSFYTEGDFEWVHRTQDHDSVVITTGPDLADALTEVLWAAQRDGLLRITLYGGRTVLVPDHHWPAFQIENPGPSPA